MNERVYLHFREFEARKAAHMVDIARRFAVEKIGGRHGVTHGTVYGFKGWACLAYWTKARAVVVREVAS